MNLFFTGSVRGLRARQPKRASIVRALEAHGTVSSPSAYLETLSGYGETELTRAEIFAREQAALAASDVVVAEITAPSLGVGYCIGAAVALGKRVIALHFGEDTLRLSAMVKGNPSVEVHAYQTEEDIARILEEALGSAH